MEYYADDRLNWIMSQKKMRPRYAGLARKVLSHYLGDLYNPHSFNAETEAVLRAMIQDVVELKVFDKEPYDWPVLDNFFRMLLHCEGYTHISYDRKVIDSGYNGVFRSELPQFHA